MAILKRGNIYWGDFRVDGKRYRVSLETTDWREALRREKQKISKAQAGLLQLGQAVWSRMTFCEAAARQNPFGPLQQDGGRSPRNPD